MYVCRHKTNKQMHVRIGTLSRRGAQANLKYVSIFRPEQLDPTEMDRAHQYPHPTPLSLSSSLPGVRNTMAWLDALVRERLLVSQIEINELPALMAG